MRAGMWVGLVTALASCGDIFDLEYVTLPDGRGGGDDGCWSSTRTDDEDGDFLVDGCDPCPADPTLPSDPDSDGDNVSDACDPDGMSASTVVAFDGFMTPLAWMPQTGMWLAGSGVYAVASGTQVRTELSIPPASYPRVDAIFDTAGDAGVYMYIGGQQLEVSCTREPRTAPAADQLVFSAKGINTQSADFDVAGTVRLRIGFAPDGTLYCLGKIGVVETMAMIASPMVGTTTTRIGLIGTTSQFHSVAVFGRK